MRAARSSEDELRALRGLRHTSDHVVALSEVEGVRLTDLDDGTSHRGVGEGDEARKAKGHENETLHSEELKEQVVASRMVHNLRTSPQSLALCFRTTLHIEFGWRKLESNVGHFFESGIGIGQKDQFCRYLRTFLGLTAGDAI